jgi:hypothetical protein
MRKQANLKKKVRDPIKNLKMLAEAAGESSRLHHFFTTICINSRFCCTTATTDAKAVV